LGSLKKEASEPENESVQIPDPKEKLFWLDFQSLKFDPLAVCLGPISTGIHATAKRSICNEKYPFFFP